MEIISEIVGDNFGHFRIESDRISEISVVISEVPGAISEGSGIILEVFLEMLGIISEISSKNPETISENLQT